MTRARLRLVQLEDLDCPAGVDPAGALLQDLAVAAFRVVVPVGESPTPDPTAATRYLVDVENRGAAAAAASQAAVFAGAAGLAGRPVFTFDVPPLAPGQSYQFQTDRVGDASLLDPQAKADWRDAIAEADESNNTATARTYSSASFRPVQRLTEVEPNDASNMNVPASAPAAVAGELTANDVDYFPLVVGGGDTGIGAVILRAEAAPGSAVAPRLDLLRAGGSLVQSAVRAAGDRLAEIRAILPAGRYDVRVSAPTAGAYRLTTDVQPTTSLGVPFLPTGSSGQAQYDRQTVLADVTGDGVPDLVTSRLDAPPRADALAAYRFPAGVVEFRPGRGNGSFGGAQFGTAASASLLFADLTGDGLADQIAIGIASSRIDAATGDVVNRWVARVYPGLGGGAFAAAPRVTDLGEQRLPAGDVAAVGGRPTGTYPDARGLGGTQVADLDGDGRPDLVAVIDLARGTRVDRTTLVAFGAAAGRLEDASVTQTVVADPDDADTRSYVRRRRDGGADVVFIGGDAAAGTTISVGSVARAADGRRAFTLAPLARFVFGGSAVVGNFSGDRADEVVIPGTVAVGAGGAAGGERNVVYAEGPDGRLVRAGVAPTLLANTAVTLRNAHGYDDVLSVPEFTIQRGLGGNAFTTDLVAFSNHYNAGALLVGDVNGDGRDEYIYEYDAADAARGAPGGPPAENPFLGMVTQGAALVGEANPRPLPPTSFDVLAHDVNGDGIDDVLALTAGRPRGADPAARDRALPIAAAVTIYLAGLDGQLGPGITLPVPVADLTAVTCGDFNGDGRADLVAAGDGRLITFLGRGDGTFARVAAEQTGYAPLAAGDVNGDGRTDVVSGTTVLLGNGDGTFTGAGYFPLDAAPISLAVQDLNRDGFDDVVYATATAVGVVRGGPALTAPVPLYAADVVNVTVLFDYLIAYNLDPTKVASLVVARGGPSGPTTFDEIVFDRPDLLTASVRTIATISAAPGFGPATDLLSADLDTNGYGDVVWSTPRGQYVIRGVGPTEFESPSRLDLTAGRNPDHLSAALVKGLPPYFLDQFVTLDRAGSGFEVVLAPNGSYQDGETGPPTFYPVAQTLTVKPGRVRAADVTGDGRPDRLSLDGEGRIALRVARPDGTYEPPILVPSYGRVLDFDVAPNTPDGPGIVAISDFGFVVVNLDPGGGFSVHSSAAYRSYFTALPGRTSRVAVADLDADGRADVVVADAAGSQLLVFLTRTDGGYATFALPTGLAPTDLRIADLDGDRFPDLVVANQGSSDVDVFLNPGVAARPAGARFLATVNPTAVEPSGAAAFYSNDDTTAVAVADVDGDRTPDLVVVHRKSQQAVILSGAGAGTFARPTGTVLDLGRDPGQAVAGDFDRDGDADLAVLMRGEGEVWVWLGDGTGRFAPPRKFKAGAAPTALAWGDANGDPYPDLLVGNAYGDVLPLLGGPAGAFAPPALPADVPLAVADVNHDGTPDVLLANPATNQVHVWLRMPGTSDFTSTYQDAQAVQNPAAVRFVDLNQDAVQDLVVLNTGGNAVRVYLGSFAPGAAAVQFTLAGEFPVGVAPAGVAVADVNRDGTPDLLTANEGSNDVSVLLGDRSGGGWTTGPGLRLASNGVGPTAVAVRDRTGDLLVFNRESSTLALLPAVGGGFFRDQSAATLALPPNLTVNPFLNLLTGEGFVADGNGTVFGFDVNNFGAGVRSVMSVGAGQAVIGLAQVDLRDGLLGLFVASAAGLLTYATPKGDAYVAVMQDQLAAGPYSAAMSVRTEAGFDVYLTSRGSDRPMVVDLGPVDATAGIAVLPVPSLDGLNTFPLTTRRLAFEAGGDPLAPVPSVNVVEAEADAGDGGPGAGAEFDPEHVSALITVLGANGPAGDDAETARRWEQWFLDLERLLREATVPPAAPTPPPAPDAAEKPAKPDKPGPDADPPTVEPGAAAPVDGPPPGAARDESATSQVPAPAPRPDGHAPTAGTTATADGPAAVALVGVLWGVRLWADGSREKADESRENQAGERTRRPGRGRFDGAAPTPSYGSHPPA